MNVSILDRAISHLRRELATIPEPDTRRPIIEAELALLDEASAYTHDWQHAAANDRGAMPTTIYGKEMALARALVERVETRLEDATGIR